MLFHLFAFSILATFTSFISGYACEKYAWTAMADWFFLGGTVCLLIIYVSIFLALTFCGLRAIFNGLRQYFSLTESNKRKVLFNQLRLRNLEQRHRLEKQQIDYRTAHRRIALFRNNNKKHIRSLSDSITANLASRRDRIPADTYRSLKKSVHQNFRAENVKGLLELHLEIMSFR